MPPACWRMASTITVATPEKEVVVRIVCGRLTHCTMLTTHCDLVLPARRVSLARLDENVHRTDIFKSCGSSRHKSPISQQTDYYVFFFLPKGPTVRVILIFIPGTCRRDCSMWDAFFPFRAPPLLRPGGANFSRFRLPDVSRQAGWPSAGFASWLAD